MIKKDEYLNVNNSIKIKSYNYQESNGFSQETAVDSHHGKYKNHKFIVEIKGLNYSIEFNHSHVVNKYAAMEDTWIEMEHTLENSHYLIVKKFENENLNIGMPKTVYNIKDFNKDIEEFRDLLIRTAEEMGIGCNYCIQMNREDDFCRTYPDRENSKKYSIPSNSLFINDNEKEFFKDFLNLKTPEEEKEFLNATESKIIEIQKAEEEKQKAAEKQKKLEEEKEISVIVNPLLKELKKIMNETSEFRYYMSSVPEGYEYTIKEVQNNIDNLEKDDLDEYNFQKYMLESLMDEVPKSQKLINDILKYISKEEYYDILEERGFIYPAERTHEPFCYSDFEEDYQGYEEEREGTYFRSEEEFLEYEYNKPRSLSERFDVIKNHINNELSIDVVPYELKETFNINSEIKSAIIDIIKSHGKIKQPPKIQKK